MDSLRAILREFLVAARKIKCTRAVYKFLGVCVCVEKITVETRVTRHWRDSVCRGMVKMVERKSDMEKEKENKVGKKL